MIQVKRYLEEHDHLENLVHEIYPHLNVDEINNNTRSVKTLVDDLISSLNVHLSVEDKSLYPLLLNHPDKHVKYTAKIFIQEMGAIRQTVLTYRRKWTSLSKMQESPDGFIEETKMILAALSRRIKKENTELFSMLGSEDISKSHKLS